MMASAFKLAKRKRRPNKKRPIIVALLSCISLALLMMVLTVIRYDVAPEFSEHMLRESFQVSFKRKRRRKMNSTLILRDTTLLNDDDEDPYKDEPLQIYHVSQKFRFEEETSGPPEAANVLWVVPWNSFKYADEDKCNYIIQRLQFSLTMKSTHVNWYPKLLIIDAGISRTYHKTQCIIKVGQIVGSQNHFVGMRDLIQGRDFRCMKMSNDIENDDDDSDEDEDNKSLPCLGANFTRYQGRQWDYENQESFTNYIHNGVIAKVDLDLGYTEDFRSRISKLEVQLFNQSVDNHFRRLGVGHFWDFQPSKSGRLRSRVTQTINSVLTMHDITGTSRLVSPRVKAGRPPADEYLRALLEHQIVVVSQRDFFEGHSRLMESLVGGALVMTDPMIHMPPRFEDGVNIVVYYSLQDLKDKILFYLKEENEEKRRLIAGRGRQMALKHYTQQRVMERLLYGKWPSDNRNVTAASIDLIH